MRNSSTEIIVVGAGIGGLAAAAALRARGMRVTVLEQADRLGEIGAGLQIGPNASRVLYRLGLEDALTWCALHAQESVRRRWSSGEILTKTTLGASAAAQFGAPYLHLHRADLHRLLLEAATTPSGPGHPVEVEVASSVTGIDESDPDRPAVLTRDGRTFRGDVIIGADGINSRIRTASGGPTKIVESGDMAYRTLIPADRVRDDPAISWLFDWPAANFWLGDNRHVVVYPVRDMQFVNVVAVVPVSDEVRTRAKAEVPAHEMREHYRGWDTRLTALLDHSDERVMAWALNYQEPFTPWSNGHIALLGDACHSMLPYFSQGASQAIEDAAVIAEELAKAERGSQSVTAALSAYTSRRAERAAAVQRGAVGNRALFHLPDGPEQRRRDDRFREHHTESDITFDWIYSGTPLDDDTPLVTA